MTHMFISNDSNKMIGNNFLCTLGPKTQRTALTICTQSPQMKIAPMSTRKERDQAVLPPFGLPETGISSKTCTCGVKDEFTPSPTLKPLT